MTAWTNSVSEVAVVDRRDVPQSYPNAPPTQNRTFAADGNSDRAWKSTNTSINGFAYLALSSTGLVLTQYDGMVSRITFPALFGELAIALWLLIKGAKVPPLAAAAS